jgi:hypothetical protein
LKKKKCFLIHHKDAARRRSHNLSLDANAISHPSLYKTPSNANLHGLRYHNAIVIRNSRKDTHSASSSVLGG